MGIRQIWLAMYDSCHIYFFLLDVKNSKNYKSSNGDFIFCKLFVETCVYLESFRDGCFTALMPQ